MTEHREPLAKATAAMMDIISQGQALQAAVLRRADAAELERIRAETHDRLDAYLDLSAQAAHAVRAITEG